MKQAIFQPLLLCITFLAGCDNVDVTDLTDPNKLTDNDIATLKSDIAGEFQSRIKAQDISVNIIKTDKYSAKGNITFTYDKTIGYQPGYMGMDSPVKQPATESQTCEITKSKETAELLWNCKP